jgi:glycosyltransferase 2 family protein
MAGALIGAVVRIVVAVIVLGLVASRVELTAVRAALVSSSPRGIVLATIASFASILVIAFRLRVLLTAQGVPARVGQTFAINLAAFFYNLFLPVGGVGVAALRLQRLSEETSGRLTAALTAIVCDRLAAVAALGLVGLACWIVDPHAKPAGGILVLLGGVSAIAFLVAPRVVPLRIRQLARQLHATRSGTWWSAGLSRFSHAVGSVARLSPMALAGIFGISILAQLPGILVFVALGDGLGLSVPLLSMGWIRSVVVVLSLLPISIGGVGVREGALVVTLHAFGVPAHQALALSILVFATTILVPGLAGGLVEGAQWLRPGRQDGA